MKKAILAKSNTIIEIICALFILLFFYTALSKSFEIESTAGVVRKTPYLSNYSLLISWSVVILEYILALALLFPRTKKLGLYGSGILMTIFTLYIGYMMAFAPDLPCSCGGVISKMNWTQHLVFNIFFILLAMTGIWLMRRNSRMSQVQEETAPIVFT